MKKRSPFTQREATRKKRPVVELEEGLPFSMSFMDSSSSKESMLRWREEMIDWLKDQHQRLETLLLRYNPFDMLASLMMLEIAYNPETYRETEHEGLAAVVEYAALAYLKHPYNSGGDLLGFDGSAVTEASARAKRILFNINLYYASEGALVEDRESEMNLDFLRFKTISHGLLVRNPAYPHHHRQQLESIFSPWQEWLIKHLGFCLDDVFRLEDAIKHIQKSHSKQRTEQEKEKRSKLIRLLDEARIGKTGGKYDSEPIVSLVQLPRKQAIAALESMGSIWLLSFLGSATLTFTDVELIQETGLPPERVAAVTNFFALNFGSSPAEFTLFSPTHELTSRPIVRHRDEMLYVTPGTLLWAIQPRLEEAINAISKSHVGQKNVWVSYQKGRAHYLECETISLLKSTLKQATAYQSLTYTTTDEKGKPVTTELDGLVIYDTTLFLIEAKAGNVVPAARRGAKESIRTVLKKLIGEAHAQAARAKAYIKTHERCEFVLPDKHKINIAGKEFTRIIPVVVTLESLDVYNAVLHEVAKTGVLLDEELPWVVSLDILRVICEVNEFPTQLIHYLKRRLRLNEFRKFYAHDELDWFGLYLSHGLYFEQDKELAAIGMVSVHSQTDQFDAYYAYKTGIRRTKAPQPRQRMPHLFRQVILELDALAEPGHSEVIMSLLEWSSSGRAEFAQHFESIRRRTKKDGETHNFSFASKNAAGITCISDFSQNYSRQIEKLTYMASLRKYEQKASNWIGLLTMVDQPKLIHGYFIDVMPWEYDAELEELTKDLIPLKVGPLNPLG